MLDSPIEELLRDPSLIEALASIEHERWSHWQNHMHQQCILLPDGSLQIPQELVHRWSTQASQEYNALSATEQSSDRDQVERYLPTIIAHLKAAVRPV